MTAALLHGDRLVAIAVALAGVALARTVFVDRENKKLGRVQSLRETLPLTLVAMLIAGVIVFDQDFGFSKAAFTGLGVGWAAITLLDAIGRRIVDPGANPDPTRIVEPRVIPHVDQDPVHGHDSVIDAHVRKLDELD